jgi:hypothetical protein
MQKSTHPWIEQTNFGNQLRIVVDMPTNTKPHTSFLPATTLSLGKWSQYVSDEGTIADMDASLLKGIHWR